MRRDQGERATPLSESVRTGLLAVARGDRITAEGEELLQAAAIEGMTGLVARASDRASRNLRVRAVAVEAESFRFARELRRIAGRFADDGLRLLCWKGLVASQQLYGSPWLRMFGDLDLVVAPADGERASKVMANLGYDEVLPLPSFARPTHRRFEPAALFCHRETKMLVDLHWRFSNPRFPLRMQFEEVWERREAVGIDDFVVFAPGGVELVLLTCSHAAKHLWHKLEMLAQIAALARQELEWDAVDEAALCAGVARQVGLSFLLVRHLLGLSAPPIPLALARAHPSLAKVRPIVEANLFSRTERKHDATAPELALLLDRRRDVLRSLLLSVFVPTDVDWQRGRGLLQTWAMRPLRLLRARWNRDRQGTG
jgi:hypothetical protein